MKKMIRAFGAATVLGALVVTGLPAHAETSGKLGEESTAMPGIAHDEYHQLVHATNNPSTMGSDIGHMGQMMGGGNNHMSDSYMGHMGQMMGGGAGHMMAFGAPPCAAEKDLSATDVKDIVEGRLAMHGNKRLKVGDVKKKDEDTFLADIVTVDDSLVERLEIDRRTGMSRRAE